MLIDKLLSGVGKLSDLTTGGWTTIGQVIDFGLPANQGLVAKTYGPGWLVHAAGATSGGASTLNLRLITSASSSLTSPVVLWSRSGILLTDLADVYNEWIGIPKGDEWLRYAAFQGQAGTAVFTGGVVSMNYTADGRMWRAYPAETGR